MIRTAVKTLVTGTVYHTGLLSLLRRPGEGEARAIILMYHRVLPKRAPSVDQGGWERYRSLPGIVVTPTLFEAQLTFLTKRYNVISLSQLLDQLDAGGPLPERSVVITFDDGWRDNYAYAYPLLQKYGIPATIFLTTAYVGTSKIFWPEEVIYHFSMVAAGEQVTSEIRDIEKTQPLAVLIKRIIKASGLKRTMLLDRLIGKMKYLPQEDREAILVGLRSSDARHSSMGEKERVMLDWSEVKEMQSGGISFGSHGVNHELLTMIGSDRVFQQLRESKRLLESKLGCSVDTLAYPNGDFNESIKRLALQSGYRCAVSVRREHVSAATDRYALGRINIHEGVSLGLRGECSLSKFACYIEKFPS